MRLREAEDLSHRWHLRPQRCSGNVNYYWAWQDWALTSTWFPSSSSPQNEQKSSLQRAPLILEQCNPQISHQDTLLTWGEVHTGKQKILCGVLSPQGPWCSDTSLLLCLNLLSSLIPTKLQVLEPSPVPNWSSLHLKCPYFLPPTIYANPTHPTLLNIISL